MNSRFRGHLRKIMIGAIAWMASGYAASITTTVHDFIVTKNGNPFFLDSFTDGLAPPSSPPFADGTAHSYHVAGVYPAGSEAGGRLVVDSANGGAGASADGTPAQTQRATLLSNSDPLNDLRGLKPNHTFIVSALADIASASGPGSFGVRLSDRIVNQDGTTNITEFLSVDYSPTSNIVRFRRQDFIAQTAHTISSIPVPVGADQVRLALSHPVAGIPVVYASAEFFDGPESMGIFNVPGPGAVFTSRGFVRAEFAAGETLPIPEPETYAMMLVGALLVGLRLRAKTRAATGQRIC